RFDRLDRSRDVALSGDDNHLRLRIELLELPHELDAVDVRQNHVSDDGVGTPGFEEFLAARTDQRGPYFVARVLEQNLQPLGHRGLIVDGEYTLLAFQTHVKNM